MCTHDGHVVSYVLMAVYTYIHVHTLGTTGMHTIPNKNEGNLCYFQCVVKPYLFLHDLLLMHTDIDVHIMTIYMCMYMYVCMGRSPNVCDSTFTGMKVECASVLCVQLYVQ